MYNIEQEKKKCYLCGESLNADVRRCPYCGSILNQKQSEVSSDNFNSELKIEESTFTEANQEEDNPVNDVISKEPVLKEKEVLYFNPYNKVKDEIKPLGNGFKVFITTVCNFIPGLGQLIGVIIAILMINSEEQDKKSFGVALLISSIILFVIYCILIFIAGLLFSTYLARMI